MPKLYIPNSNFTGVSHGLNFVNGVTAKNVADTELIGRMLLKGYKVVEKETNGTNIEVKEGVEGE